MMRVPAARVLSSLILAVIVVAGLAVPAEAQYRPLPTSGYGTNSGPKSEPYHVEAGFNIWNPAPDFVIASESLGIQGTKINVRADLDIEQKRTFEFRLELRPSKRNKFRFHYMPLSYNATTNLKADIVFNGIKYPISSKVDSVLEWKTYRMGYEVDVISRSQGFLGLILEAKYTDANFQLTSPFGVEYARARAPIPAVGVVGRVYIARIASVTGEFTGFKLPSSIDENYQAHYYDWDFYGTVDLTHNFGVRAGYRSLSLGYLAKKDSGDATLRGLYIGGVARF